MVSIIRPGEIPASAFGPPIPVSEEDKKKAAEIRNNLIKDAAILLRKAGAIVEFLGCRNVVRITHDNIDVGYEDDIVKFAIDGVDVADSIVKVSIGMGPGAYPVITATFGTFPWKINDDLNPEEKKTKMHEAFSVLAKKRK